MCTMKIEKLSDKNEEVKPSVPRKGGTIIFVKMRFAEYFFYILEMNHYMNNNQVVVSWKL